MSEVLLLRICQDDKNLWDKLVDLLTESGYQINYVRCNKDSPEQFLFEGLEIIPEQHQVFLNGNEVILTGKEFQILMLLAENRVSNRRLSQVISADYLRQKYLSQSAVNETKAFYFG